MSDLTTIEDEQEEDEVRRLESPGDEDRELDLDLMDDDDGDDEDLEATRLTLKQKVAAGLTMLLSFTAFLVLFIYHDPNPIVRYVISKTMKRTAAVDFRNIDLNLLGADVVTDPSITFLNGSSISASSIRMGLSYWGLLNKNPDGTIKVRKFDANLAGVSARLRQVSSKMDITNIDQSVRTWNGRFQLTAKGVELDSLPPAVSNFLSPDTLAKLKISGFELRARIERGGRLQINRAIIRTNLFPSISLTGKNGRVTSSITKPTIDANICITPAADLETKNKELFNLYTGALGGSAGGRACFLCPVQNGDFSFTKCKKVSGT